jgi:hypothetical protein
MKKLALVIGVTVLCGQAMAQDAKTVIADAQRALGGVNSITYSGSARNVAFQQCGGNAAALICYGTHDPMQPITSYVRVIDLAAPLSRHTGATMNFGGGGNTTPAAGTFFQQVTAEQARGQNWGQAPASHPPWASEGRRGQRATPAAASRQGYTVLTGAAASAVGRVLRRNGFVNGDNLSSASRRGSARTSWATCTSLPTTPATEASATRSRRRRSCRRAAAGRSSRST